MSRTLLRNALIVPVIGAPAYGSLLIEDGAIAAVGDVAPGGFDGDVVDCNGSIVLPGLINAHLHPELHVLKGIVEEMDLHALDEAEHLEPALVYLGSHAGRAVQEVAIRASITDCLLGGTTCIATYGVTLGSTETAAAILDEIGVRGWVTIRDAAFEPVSADAYARPAMYRLHAEEALSATELAAAAEAHARG
jgi:cytosine/adenosine deaminase-related metal-dependent hydrolase